MQPRRDNAVPPATQQRQRTRPDRSSDEPGRLAAAGERSTETMIVMLLKVLVRTGFESPSPAGCQYFLDAGEAGRCSQLRAPMTVSGSQ
jgi:hypothetical protein